MPLLPSFQGIESKADINKCSDDDLAKEDSKKKQKSDKKEKQEKSVVVKNKHWHKSFKIKQGETWKRTSKSAYVDSRPSWDGEKTKKCALNGIFTKNVMTTVTGKRVRYQRMMSLPRKRRRCVHSWWNFTVNRDSHQGVAVPNHPQNHLIRTFYLSLYHIVKIHDQILFPSRRNSPHVKLSSHMNF